MRGKAREYKTKRLVVLVAPLEHKMMRKIAKREGISVAEFVRLSIKVCLTPERREVGGDNGN